MDKDNLEILEKKLAEFELIMVGLESVFQDLKLIYSREKAKADLLGIEAEVSEFEQRK